MNYEHKGINLAIAMLQSTFVFILLLIALSLPHLFHDTFTAVLGGQPLPPLTKWLGKLSNSGTGIMCIATMIGITHACLGSTLVQTARSSTEAMNRLALLSTATWGFLLVALAVIALAHVVPLLTFYSILSDHEEAQIKAAEARKWIITAVVYSGLLIAMTMRICSKYWRRT